MHFRQKWCRGSEFATAQIFSMKCGAVARKKKWRENLAENGAVGRWRKDFKHGAVAQRKKWRAPSYVKSDREAENEMSIEEHVSLIDTARCVVNCIGLVEQRRAPRRGARIFFYPRGPLCTWSLSQKGLCGKKSRDFFATQPFLT
jgi:hypothetical protein